jgi:hypothetical protein
MTILETVREAIYNGTDRSIKLRHLYLAYLMLHMENPAIHPDEYLYVEGGYDGWMVVLTHHVWEKEESLPDSFKYPSSFLQLGLTLQELDFFHDDLVENAAEGEELEQANDLLACLNSISCWTMDMKPSELQEAIDCLQKLYLYHACENDTAEEEAEKPAGVLRACLDTLIWIQSIN